MTTIRICVASLLLVICAGSNASAQNPTPRVSTEEEIKLDLNGPCKQDERLDAVKRLFVKMGVPAEDIRSEKTKDAQNVIFTKRGTSAETIIVGAHYDKVSSGCGIIDNWSGVVILAHLIRTMMSMKTEKTFVFAAFDREEDGLKGSKAMAKDISKESLGNYCSMVNLDSFGLGYPMIVENLSTDRMTKYAKELGTELKVPVTPVILPGVNSDSLSFRDRKIPAITISALSDDWPKYLHSENDTIENTNVASVTIGYLFSLELVARIDRGSCAMFSKK